MTNNSPLTDSLLEEFIAIVGEQYALRADENDLTQYTHENRGIYSGSTPLVLKPGTTEEVSKLVELAARHHIPIIPQGGHTGHAAGGVPSDQGNELIIITERLNRVREIDLAGNTMTVEAGVILQQIQQTADENERLFPLSLAAEGSCQIGGNISTNAGGTAVLAYGNTRDMVMGLEVVLPSGEIWNGLRKLKKDNTGYDLKQLFIGAEGTLGIVTAAVLKLFPKPRGREVAFVAVSTPEEALQLLEIAQSHAGQSLTSFELMARMGLGFVYQHLPGNRDPLQDVAPWYVLMEISSGRSAADARQLMETVLEEAYEKSVLTDAAMAESIAQQREFWGLREHLPSSQKFEGGSIKHDIAVPVKSIPEFLERAEPIVHRVIPNARICAFGHMGDGNLHYNITQPETGTSEAFLALRQTLNDEIHDLVADMEGSVSAEHGIGKLKRELLYRVKSPVEMALMTSVKESLDPLGIMNPGKIIRS